MGANLRHKTTAVNRLVSPEQIRKIQAEALEMIKRVDTSQD